MCAFSSCPPCLHIQATLCACVLQGTPLCAPQGTPAHACLSTKTTNYIPFSLLKNNIYYYIIIAKAKILKKKLSSIFLWLIRVCYFHEKTILQKYLSQTIIITLILGSHSFENSKVITKYLSYSLNSNFSKFSFEPLKNHKKVDFLRFSSNMVAIF